jgi:hypothetical protein
MADSTSPEKDTAAVDKSQQPVRVPEGTQGDRKALNKARRDDRRARKAAAQAAEEAALVARREAARKRKEALKITVVDGNVVDDEGRVIRPYSRAERFLDNKPLVYSLLIAFIIACLILTVLFMGSGKH